MSWPNEEVEWCEARIPPSYTSKFGSPLLAAIGRRECRSVAIAASRGLCVLDCYCVVRTQVGRARQLVKTTDLQRTLSSNVGDSSRSGREGSPRWRLFSSEAEEGSFRVLAMTWWEGNGVKSDDVDQIGYDDLLLAVIEHTDGSRSRRFLSCWSRRR
jgi:hypothetical protein